MSDAIIVALITGGVSLVGILATYRANSRKVSQEFAKANAEYQRQAAAADAKLELRMTVVETKIESLTAEVRRHNGFAERLPVIEERIAVANHRIADLEGNAHP